jgi:hypothetical protein
MHVFQNIAEVDATQKRVRNGVMSFSETETVSSIAKRLGGWSTKRRFSLIMKATCFVPA